MGTWNSRGLRGSSLEELINMTNDKYQELHMALVQKIPTPIKPVSIDKNSRHITLAYFEQKSTVDYIGVAQNIPICFDAKECNTDTFPMQNIHKHQVEFMREFENQGGISFMIIYYTNRNEMYYLPFYLVEKFYLRSAAGGRKSFRFEEIDLQYQINTDKGVPVHYLETLAIDLQNRD
ncbi:MAG: Holliday junction resolvase RecU [Lachnospiraceae bacterium]|nr:Holliday junction resolvase RecU [Lachnospiraceae bacterium]